MEEDEWWLVDRWRGGERTYLAKGSMDVTVGIGLEWQTRDVLLHTLLDVLIIGKHGAFVWGGHLLLENTSDGLEQGQHAVCGQADVEVQLASNDLLNQLLATNMLGPGGQCILCSLVLWGGAVRGVIARAERCGQTSAKTRTFRTGRKVCGRTATPWKGSRALPFFFCKTSVRETVRL